MADRGWIPLVWPVPSSKVITQGFGENFASYQRSGGWKIGHSGLDIRTRTDFYPSGIGTPIVAARGGTVNHAGEHFYANGTPTGYGLAVILDHADGTKTLYAHNSRVHVAKGDKVTAGQRIADAGATGNVTGPHLHFELWKPPFNEAGVWGRVDPTAMMEEILFTGGFGTRSLDDEEPIHHERGLEDVAECYCPPFVPEE